MQTSFLISKQTAQKFLLAAAIYNMLWGALVVLFPRWSFELSGAPAPVDGLFLWQCIGMIVGVYGIGYAAASLDPFRHWPIILVGLLGKIFGPIGFVWSLAQGSITTGFLVHIVPNDLIWWIPFALILWSTALRYQHESFPPSTDDDLLKLEATSFLGESRGTIASISKNSPTLVVFLRHAGCSFCRELLADLAASRSKIGPNTTVVLVTMEATAAYRALVERLGLTDMLQVVDPSGAGYRAAGLRRAPLSRLFGVREFLLGARAALRYGVGPLAGDGWMLSGSVLVVQGRIVARSLTTRASEKPEICLQEQVAQ